MVNIVVPEGVILAKNVMRNNVNNDETRYMFVSLTFSYGSLTNDSDLPLFF